ncbi:hypothetical protein JYU34_001131 [Plutella xylostella]|uniref:Peptidase S1 domain-containing protein n=1 Tax=Plutella xylostella TaxID=51655 RepID=A0ABQ7R625_PLUXY|nr:hypothetical protein JYU34_001131 [Plutella xylostella]
MVSEKWKVILVLCAAAAAERPGRALSVHQPRRSAPMFVPRRRPHSRVLFLDDEENRQPYGRGEIDLTQSYGKIKFDDSTDYDFTSPEDTTEPTKHVELDKELTSGNERFYEPLGPRIRNQYPSIIPQFYTQGRFARPYAPNFGFDPYYVPGNSFAPAVRNSFYNPNQGWKARSPRVVFPFQDPGVNSLVQTNSHGGPGGFNDNVVFRDQNFGLNDVGTDDLALQDIGTGNAEAFAERDANVPHRARNDETKRMDQSTNIQYKIYKYTHTPIDKRIQSKPMFIQTDGAKILPPDLKYNYYEYTNISKGFGGKAAVVPKFKPITDEQMMRISEILNQLPKRSTNEKQIISKTGRRGKVLADSAGVESQSIEVVTEATVKKDTDRQDETCAQGGTCEFFIYCWMVGGLLEGTCGGLLKGCCHRVAKAGILGVQDSNSIDYTSNELNFGPVINDQSCGIAVNKQTAQRRIVGGDDAGFGTFPWQAYIRIGSSRCGGSLISRRHVVTAGHCVARAQPRHVRVTLGDYVINSAAEPLPAYTFGVRGIKVHPLFKFTPQADRFDVAVLTLDRNVHYMPHIAPICLPERGSDFLGQYGWAAGWGALSPGSRLRPRTLQAVDVPVLDNRVCERWHRANGINVVIYPEMLCAGYRGGGKDSCQGDSGGPLMLERAGRWYLIGVVSAGYSCASRGQPGIYHRVAHTVDWISHATTQS